MVESEYEHHQWNEPVQGSEGKIHLFGIHGYYHKYPPYNYEEMGIHYLWNGFDFEPTSITMNHWDNPGDIDQVITFGIDSSSTIYVLNYDIGRFFSQSYKNTSPDQPIMQMTVTPNDSWYLDYQDIISAGGQRTVASNHKRLIFLNIRVMSSNSDLNLTQWTPVIINTWVG